MGAVTRQVVTLPAEQADFIAAQVAAGHYASADEVVQAGLRALQARDDATDTLIDRFNALQCEHGLLSDEFPTL